MFTFLSACSEADEIYKICGVIGSPNQNSWAEGLELANVLKYQFPQVVSVFFYFFIFLMCMHLSTHRLCSLPSVWHMRLPFYFFPLVLGILGIYRNETDSNLHWLLLDIAVCQCPSFSTDTISQWGRDQPHLSEHNLENFALVLKPLLHLGFVW